MAGFFQIARTANGQFTFNLEAGNHEVILTSRMYVSIPAARDAIEMLRESSAIGTRFERRTDSDNAPLHSGVSRRPDTRAQRDILGGHGKGKGYPVGPGQRRIPGGQGIGTIGAFAPGRTLPWA